MELGLKCKVVLVTRGSKGIGFARCAGGDLITNVEAEAVVFLSSPRAGYTTGVTLSMDGGVFPVVI